MELRRLADRAHRRRRELDADQLHADRGHRHDPVQDGHHLQRPGLGLQRGPEQQHRRVRGVRAGWGRAGLVGGHQQLRDPLPPASVPGQQRLLHRHRELRDQRRARADGQRAGDAERLLGQPQLLRRLPPGRGDPGDPRRQRRGHPVRRAPGHGGGDRVRADLGGGLGQSQLGHRPDPGQRDRVRHQLRALPGSGRGRGRLDRLRHGLRRQQSDHPPGRGRDLQRRHRPELRRAGQRGGRRGRGRLHQLHRRLQRLRGRRLARQPRGL